MSPAPTKRTNYSKGGQGEASIWTLGNVTDLPSYPGHPPKTPLEPLSERLDMVDRAVIVLGAVGLVFLGGVIIAKGRGKQPITQETGLGRWVWVGRPRVREAKKTGSVTDASGKDNDAQKRAE